MRLPAGRGAFPACITMLEDTVTQCMPAGKATPLRLISSAMRELKTRGGCFVSQRLIDQAHETPTVYGGAGSPDAHQPKGQLDHGSVAEPR